MNIFIVDHDPLNAARMLCNQHVCKMIVESAQLMCNALDGPAPYRPTHVNNPCSVWTRTSVGNYQWLLAHALELCAEYTRRFKRVHKTESIVEHCLLNPPTLPDVGVTPFARAIKEPWKRLSASMDIVSAYRFYYVGDKSRFARWAPRAEPPAWWPRG